MQNRPISCRNIVPLGIHKGGPLGKILRFGEKIVVSGISRGQRGKVASLDLLSSHLVELLLPGLGGS